MQSSLRLEVLEVSWEIWKISLADYRIVRLMECFSTVIQLWRRLEVAEVRHFCGKKGMIFSCRVRCSKSLTEKLQQSFIPYITLPQIIPSLLGFLNPLLNSLKKNKKGFWKVKLQKEVIFIISKITYSEYETEKSHFSFDPQSKKIIPRI